MDPVNGTVAATITDPVTTDKNALDSLGRPKHQRYIPPKPEACHLGGLIQGKRNKDSGHMKKVQALGTNSPGAHENRHKFGQSTKLSGHSKALGLRNAVDGTLAFARHTRWHVVRVRVKRWSRGAIPKYCYWCDDKNALQPSRKPMQHGLKNEIRTLDARRFKPDS
jgi:hypothetical protein